MATDGAANKKTHVVPRRKGLKQKPKLPKRKPNDVLLNQIDRLHRVRPATVPRNKPVKQTSLHRCRNLNAEPTHPFPASIRATAPPIPSSVPPLQIPTDIQIIRALLLSGFQLWAGSTGWQNPTFVPASFAAVAVQQPCPQSQSNYSRHAPPSTPRSKPTQPLGPHFLLPAYQYFVSLDSRLPLPRTMPHTN